jgi:hypothetical protein
VTDQRASIGGRPVHAPAASWKAGGDAVTARSMQVTTRTSSSTGLPRAAPFGLDASVSVALRETLAADEQEASGAFAGWRALSLLRKRKSALAGADSWPLPLGVRFCRRWLGQAQRPDRERDPGLEVAR